MYTIKYKIIFILVMFTAVHFSCQKLDELNINPNGVDPADAHPDLLVATVITTTGKKVVDLGFGDLAGVMQHTQKDGWSGGHNSYDWNSQKWSSHYGILRNADELYNKATDMDLAFHRGIALIFKAYNFGLITDLWGDAPYSQALKGELMGENLQPAFDPQEEIYTGILAMLDTANMLLSESEYGDIDKIQDVIYDGDPIKWRKFANSLALRYYMRLSEKSPAVAEAGIKKITTDPSIYPLITNASDDANMSYIGTSSTDSWPANTVFDGTSGSDYRRKKLCSTLCEKLQVLNDPRIAIWANKVEIPLAINPSLGRNEEELVGGIRYVSQDTADVYENQYGYPLDLDTEYVGLPPAWAIIPQAYNLNPNLNQAPNNPHASHLNDIYKEAAGKHLKSRMMTATEVNFILAEGALKGWTAVGSAQGYYEAGVKASFDAWDIGGDYADYIAGPLAVYNGTLEQIIEQKWIASWTTAAEAWFDWRRTGFPTLSPGKEVKRDAIPLRFYYSVDELELNSNTQTAIDKLVTTPFSNPDGKNSAWSKMWLLQGTTNPY